jgi:hypothetical protein
MASLEGKPVDRPPVNFYEIGGHQVDPENSDPFNIYNHPSWKPLLDLAEEQTDLIRMSGPVSKKKPENCESEFFTTEEFVENGSRVTTTRIEVAGRTLTKRTRRDPDVDTIWTIEHLLKDLDDLEAYLQLPDEVFGYDYSVENLFEEDRRIGDRGIVMVDTADPICVAADLFHMENYILIAHQEREAFRRLLEKCSIPLYERTEVVAREFPGHLWRVFGPEYATVPYLPPNLFEEYVVPYTGHIVKTIREYGGFARLHSHGNIRDALPHIVAMGCDATDPIEPPPQGNVQLADVRRDYGKDLTLFGNIEVSDLENMEPSDFEMMVAKTLQDGTAGEGKGFVLMPTACPYGREITSKTMTNYETMVRLATGV